MMDLSSASSQLVGTLLSFLTGTLGDFANLLSAFLAIILFPVNLLIFIISHAWLFIAGAEFIILLQTVTAKNPAQMATRFMMGQLTLLKSIIKMFTLFIEILPKLISSMMSALGQIAGVVSSAAQSPVFWIIAAILAFIMIFVNGIDSAVYLINWTIQSFINAFDAIF